MKNTVRQFGRLLILFGSDSLHIVLLSGGSGKRLWPLSNDIRSKQFIPLFPQVDGEYISMAQRVFRQIRKVDKAADITVATSKSQVSTLKNQLGDNVDISVEPCRRDTFPAIALASMYLKDVRNVDIKRLLRPEEKILKQSRLS